MRPAAALHYTHTSPTVIKAGDAVLRRSTTAWCAVSKIHICTASAAFFPSPPRSPLRPALTNAGHADRRHRRLAIGQFTDRTDQHAPDFLWRQCRTSAVTYGQQGRRCREYRPNFLTVNSTSQSCQAGGRWAGRTGVNSGTL